MPVRMRGAVLLLLASLLITSCGSPTPAGDDLLTPIDELGHRTGSENEPLRVVASNSIVADVARQVSGNLARVDALLPPGSDPHGLDLVPADLQRIEGADLVLVSGFGLDTPILSAIGAAGLTVPIVSVSEGLQPLRLDPAAPDEEDDHDHEGEGADPHVWLNPLNVVQWTENIAAALGNLEPDQRAAYRRNAEAYIRELHDLDRWVEGTLQPIPASKRLLVSDHASLAYFAEQYGFQVLGAVIPSYSTQAEPAPQDLARLAGLIEEHQVVALFVDAGANRSAMTALSEDLGVSIEVLYEGSLSGPSGPAETYLELMRYNVTTIVGALAPGADG